MRSEKVDIEEIASTKSEKLLAVVLAIFLSIGVIWAYTRIDNAVGSAISRPRDAAVEGAQRELEAAYRRSELVIEAFNRADSKLTFARESYRTALESKQPAAALKRRYEAANAAFLRATANQHRTAGDLARARSRYARVVSPFSRRVNRVNRERTLTTMVFRVLLALLILGLGYWVLAFLRRRRSRYLPLAFAVIASGSLLCLIGAADYTNEYLDLRDLGPIVLSLAGIAATLGAFFALQRYLARRIPVRRVRKGECPFCGYPSRGGGVHCEGCGREVIGECSSCGRERRVGTAFCASCGRA
ncbi:MAG: zinc ribbon domain-containing protein [Gaiellaceae bacterium]